MHSGAQIAGVFSGNAGDQIGGSSQSQRRRETANHRGNLAFQSERYQGVIDGAFANTSPRDTDVPCGGIAGGSDFALPQRVPRSVGIAARAAQGLGAAVMMALTMAFVGEAVPKARTGSAMGLLGTMSAIGTALGPSLGGILIASFGWQAIFFVNVPLGVVALVLAQRYLPADRRASKADQTSFDNVGTLLLALTLAAYALAMTIGSGGFGLVNIALLAAAALGVVLFVLAEARTASPLIAQSGTCWSSGELKP